MKERRKEGKKNENVFVDESRQQGPVATWKVPSLQRWERIWGKETLHAF